MAMDVDERQDVGEQHRHDRLQRRETLVVRHYVGTKVGKESLPRFAAPAGCPALLGCSGGAELVLRTQTVLAEIS